MKSQICMSCYIWISICITFYLIHFYTQHPSNTYNSHQIHDVSSTFMQYYKDCDLFAGQWIRDTEPPLYTDKTCPMMGDPRNCFKNGRKDTDFLKWIWRPDGCQLSRFNPNLFLEIVRGKTMAFIGDSVSRNHMESLLCLLAQGEKPVDIDTHIDKKNQKWYFPNHDFTLMVVWTMYLVQDEQIFSHGSPTDDFNLHIDKVHEAWHKELPSVLDYAVISGGHWFFGRVFYLYQDDVLIGCVACSEPNIPKYDSTYALRMSFRTALKYTERFKGITTVLTTFSPGHFENGEWKSGGSCNRTGPFHELADAIKVPLYNRTVEVRQVQLEELERAKRSGIKERRLLALDVTRASLMRPDGHPDTHYQKGFETGRHDCIHWCLPGPIDAWSELLLGILLKETAPHIL